MVWWEYGDEGGVLELDCRFELQVFRQRCGMLAWWLTDSGTFVGFAEVGVA